MNGFVAEKIPDESAERLVYAILTDTIFRYARALIRIKDYEFVIGKNDHEVLYESFRTVDEIETFLNGKWFKNLADYVELNVSGKEIIKMIRKSPKKYANKTGRRRSNNVEY